MATEGDKDTPFTCQLKMEEQIFCAHTVKLTAPGLVINKAGTEATELSYSFAAGQGLVSQDIGIVGHNPGDYYLFADITSPYYVSSNGLKIKKDKIKIRIKDGPPPDGWKGIEHGVLWYSNYPPYWQEPDLYYRYTHPAGPSVTFIVGILPSARSIGMRAVGPVTLESGGYNTSTSTAVTISVPGVYNIYVYTNMDLGQSNIQTTLETLTFTARLQGSTVFSNATATRRGRVHKQTTTVGSSPFSGVPFGAIVVEHALAAGGGAPYYVRLPSGVGGQTYTCTSSGVPPSASGSLGTGQSEAGTIRYPAPGGAEYGADVVLTKV